MDRVKATLSDFSFRGSVGNVASVIVLIPFCGLACRKDVGGFQAHVLAFRRSCCGTYVGDCTDGVSLSDASSEV